MRLQWRRNGSWQQLTKKLDTSLDTEENLRHPPPPSTKTSELAGLAKPRNPSSEQAVIDSRPSLIGRKVSLERDFRPNGDRTVRVISKETSVMPDHHKVYLRELASTNEPCLTGRGSSRDFCRPKRPSPMFRAEQPSSRISLVFSTAPTASEVKVLRAGLKPVFGRKTLTENKTIETEAISPDKGKKQKSPSKSILSNKRFTLFSRDRPSSEAALESGSERKSRLQTAGMLSKRVSFSKTLKVAYFKPRAEYFKPQI